MAIYRGRRLTSTLKPAAELQLIRRRSADLVHELGYNTVAKEIRLGGPLARNLIFVRDTIEGRKLAAPPITAAVKRQHARVDALKQGFEALIDRVRELGG